MHEINRKTLSLKKKPQHKQASPKAYNAATTKLDRQETTVYTNLGGRAWLKQQLALELQKNPALAQPPKQP